MVVWRRIIHIRDDEVGGKQVGTRTLSEVLLLASMSHVGPVVNQHLLHQHLLHQDHESRKTNENFSVFNLFLFYYCVDNMQVYNVINLLR